MQFPQKTKKKKIQSTPSSGATSQPQITDSHLTYSTQPTLHKTDSTPPTLHTPKSEPSLNPLEAGIHATTSSRCPHRSVGPTTGIYLPEKGGQKIPSDQEWPA